MPLTPSELHARMKGVVIVTATPFNADGSLDEPGLRSNARWLVERCRGRDFILTPLGSTGEFYALTEAERRRVIEIVVEEVAGELPVIVGAANPGTLNTMAACLEAQAIGADGVQLVLPYYVAPTEAGMLAHFRTVAEALEIGVMLYNNPGVSKAWIPPHVMAQLAEVDQIVADKENTPEPAQYYWMREAVDPARMAILCGVGELMFSFEAVFGCPGFVTWVGNFLPDVPYAMYEAASRRDFDEVAACMERIRPLFAFVDRVAAAYGPSTGLLPSGMGSGLPYIAVMKAAMELLGLAGGPPREPLLPLNDGERLGLARIVKELRRGVAGTNAA